MPSAQTVLGPVPAEQLGLTLSHEHLLGRPLLDDADPDLVLDDIAAAASELARFHEAGGGTVVEVTPVDYGRDLQGLAELSRQTGVHIIAATGHHKDRWSAPFTTHAEEDELVARFTGELREGVDGVRAGVIKVGGSRDRLTAGEQRAFRAAARAQLATGAPITTHTEHGQLALEQVDLLLACGAHPERVVIGHLDLEPDVEYHESVLRAGVYVGYDQVGKAKYGPDEARAAGLAELVRRGYSHRLLVSGDLARRSYWHAYSGEPGLDYIPRKFADLLVRAGLSAAQVEELLVANPARVFAWLD
jgi:phosphotriesterase-related protein